MVSFFQRHVFASIFGAVGALLAAIGYADQAGAIITKYEPWQLQACGAALFAFFVVKVLASYDETQAAKVSGEALAPVSTQLENLNTNTELNGQSDILTSEILPTVIANEYIDLMCSEPTQLQQRKMLKPYEGKWLVLELYLYSLTDGKKEITAMMHYKDKKRESAFIWVKFGKNWEDHLHKINKGSSLRLKGRISVGETGAPQFVDAIPLI